MWYISFVLLTRKRVPLQAKAYMAFMTGNMLPYTLLLSSGFIGISFAQVNFTTTNFLGAFASGSGVLESLRPASDPSFDFSPSDYFSLRDGAGQYHTGDITFRYRLAESDAWTEANTAAQRENTTTVPSLAVSASLNSASPNASSINTTRTWGQVDGDLTLSFTIENTGSSTLEIGSLGLPIEFNNIFTGRTAVETTNKCVLLDPYIGVHAGYIQTTRLTGFGPELVITPLNNETKFEAWRFLDEPQGELGYQQQTYEGNYAWEIFTKAYAENEWRNAEPWNPPTSRTLAPGESLTVGLRFSVAPSVQHIEATVCSVGVPVAVGIPGYVLPHDLTAKLFLNSTFSILSWSVEPASALTLTQCDTYEDNWTGYDVTANTSAFGRARLTLQYADGRTQAIHYWIAHASPQALSELGSFLTNEQW